MVASETALRLPIEITVFLPRVGERSPVETAKELVEALNVGRATVGEDLLTGGILIRLPYDATLQGMVVSFLSDHNVLYEIDLQ